MTNDKRLMRFLFSLFVSIVPLCASNASKSDAKDDRTVATAGSQAIDGPKGPAFQSRNPRYHITLGDVLELTFAFVPEFNETVTVQPDGFITLKAQSALHVQGLTMPELIDTLHEVYGKVLHDPVITVDFKEFEKPYFVVSGKVIKPGKYDLRGDTTVTQGIAIAGGLDDDAKHSQVLLIRRASDDWTEVRTINVKEMLHGINLQEDPHLRPGDMLFVPKNTTSKIKAWIPTGSLGMFLNRF
jgi:polysaccharide export outer membrane protein